MYLRQIELENFKSFGKKLTVPLLEGYTAVTGPNGSGKSNISDAILFVLGPKSSRAIRAGKLTDLIFNGGPNRQPANHCKVSLVFDNKDRMIPIDEDVVRLSRFIKRSTEGDGYSSYFYVNDRKSSLSEFDMLLSNARISADGYNFVQQGDVTRIVTMSNLERRRVLEDISGISKFDEEILKAQRERDEADANIGRISIILSEIQRQIDQLEQEKEVAMTYLRTKETLTRSKAQLAHRQRETAEADVASTQRQIGSIESEILRLRDRKVQIAERVKQLDESMLQVDEELEAKGGMEFRELKDKIDAVRVLVARSDDRAAAAESTITELKGDLEALKVEKDASTRENHSLVAQYDEAAALLKQRSEELAGSKQQLSEVQGKISACDSELAELENEIASREKEVREREEALNHQGMDRERLEGRSQRLEAELAVLDEGIKTQEFGVTDAEWRIKEIRDQDRGSGKELKKLQEEYLQKRNAESRMSRESDELEQAIKSLQRELSRLKAEEEAAGEIARGYNRAVRGIMEARDSRTIRGIHGTIAELAEVDPQYQTALNIAAGNRMQAIVVDDDEVASQCIQHLKRNGLGRATFLPLTKMLDGRPRGKAIMAAREAVGFAIDLVKFDERYRAAFWYVLGDTVVVDTLERARRLMGGVRLVTSGGELLEASGAMVGGNVEQSQLKFGAASKGRLEEVSTKLDAALESAARLQESLREVRADMLAVEGRIRELTGAGGASSVTLKALEGQREEMRSRLVQQRGEREKKQADLSEAVTAICALREKMRQGEEELDTHRASRDDARARMEKLAPKELSLRLKELQAKVSDLTEVASGLRAERDTLDARIKLNQKRVEELVSAQRQIDEKLVKLQHDREEAAALAASSRTELVALRKIEDSMGAEMNDLRQRKENIFREKTSLEGERDNLSSAIETKGEIIVGLNTRIAQGQVRARELEEELRQLNVQVVLPIPSLEVLRDTIRQCDNAINSMGPVNLRALDDYEERRRRFDELSGESARLEAQRKDLIRLENELNIKKKASLNKVYEAVNDNFRRAYAELSQGGEAELVMENKEEPFQGGLAIKARPKQGKVLRLEALSGGEKSLTALAFIFAIQEYQPSPFYLLDEVDMFLDGINADMVAKRVQKSSKTAQFVQISLRKITLTKADHVIGVTKQDGGISHVIMRPNVSEVRDFQAEFKIPDEKLEEETT